VSPRPAADAYRSQAATTASGPRLLVMLFDRLGADLEVALGAMGPERDVYRATQALIHAQEIVTTLRLALDPDGFSAGHELQAIYLFVEKQLVQANLEKDPTPVRDCQRVLQPLHQAWRMAVEQVERGLVGVS
jgi:flagellar protein FliS